MFNNNNNNHNNRKSGSTHLIIVSLSGFRVRITMRIKLWLFFLTLTDWFEITWWYTGIEICERLSTMGIAVNLVTYLINTMHLPSSTSANVVTDFMGTSFLLCLLGGFLADSFLGRYKTIAIFSIIQTLVGCFN